MFWGIYHLMYNCQHFISHYCHFLYRDLFIVDNKRHFVNELFKTDSVNPKFGSLTNIPCITLIIYLNNVNAHRNCLCVWRETFGCKLKQELILETFHAGSILMRGGFTQNLKVRHQITFIMFLLNHTGGRTSETGYNICVSGHSIWYSSHVEKKCTQ